MDNVAGNKFCHIQVECFTGIKPTSPEDVLPKVKILASVGLSSKFCFRIAVPDSELKTFESLALEAKKVKSFAEQELDRINASEKAQNQSIQTDKNWFSKKIEHLVESLKTFNFVRSDFESNKASVDQKTLDFVTKLLTKADQESISIERYDHSYAPCEMTVAQVMTRFGDCYDYWFFFCEAESIYSEDQGVVASVI